MTDTEAITNLLQRYERSLNDSDLEAVMKLYSADGIFMPQHFDSSVGAEAVRRAYDGIFRAIKLTVQFRVEEVRPISAEWAFARTHSSGNVLVYATGASSAEANQELFVLQKVEGEWKIARYCFSTTNPPRT